IGWPLRAGVRGPRWVVVEDGRGRLQRVAGDGASLVASRLEASEEVSETTLVRYGQRLPCPVCVPKRFGTQATAGRGSFFSRATLKPGLQAALIQSPTFATNPREKFVDVFC